MWRIWLQSVVKFVSPAVGCNCLFASTGSVETCSNLVLLYSPLNVLQVNCTPDDCFFLVIQSVLDLGVASLHQAGDHLEELEPRLLDLPLPQMTRQHRHCRAYKVRPKQTQFAHLKEGWGKNLSVWSAACEFLRESWLGTYLDSVLHVDLAEDLEVIRDEVRIGQVLDDFAYGARDAGNVALKDATVLWRTGKQ